MFPCHAPEGSVVWHHRRCCWWVRAPRSTCIGHKGARGKASRQAVGDMSAVPRTPDTRPLDSLLRPRLDTHAYNIFPGCVTTLHITRTTLHRTRVPRLDLSSHRTGDFGHLSSVDFHPGNTPTVSKSPPRHRKRVWKRDLLRARVRQNVDSSPTNPEIRNRGGGEEVDQKT